MSEFADCTEALISAATSIITPMAKIIIASTEESKNFSADELKAVINNLIQRDELLNQSSLQANKHVIEYLADIYKETPYGRQCYYAFNVIFELEFLDRTETDSAMQMSYLLTIRNTMPFFYNIRNPLMRQCRDLILQKLLSYAPKVRMLLSADKESVLCSNVFNIIENQSNEKDTPQKTVIKYELEDDLFIADKFYHDLYDDLYELNLDTCKWTESDVLRERYQHEFLIVLEVVRELAGIVLPRVQCDSLHEEDFDHEKEVFFVGGFGKLYKANQLCRYNKEFEKEVFIAGGGFGKVYKARHCLDGKEYAIKKIMVKRITEKQLNEVWTLATLSHPNIVSYNTAWIEPPFDTWNSSTNSILSRTSKLDGKDSKSSSLLAIKDFEKYYTDESSSDATFSQNNDINDRFEKLDLSTNNMEKNVQENTTEESSSDIVSFRNSKSNENANQVVVKTSTDNSSSCEESSREVNIYTSDKNKPYTLNIQMALCEQTLEQWLCDKTSAIPEPITKTILEQIVCGVDYVHSQKIVHHDIKPSNIFISTSGQLRVQLGDFGLACWLRKEHHSAIGTPMYAAPEQMQGKCDPKSDIYSIGVVFIKLLISIKTETELSYIIRSLKSGEVPEALKQHKWAQMIQQLVQEDPTNRPSASQLLQGFNHDKNVTIKRLEDTIVHLENNNNKKDDIIQNLLQENALLKEKNQELSRTMQQSKLVHEN